MLGNEYQFLRDCFSDWCERYFARRLKQHNPRDCNNPLETFRRLVTEFCKIIGDMEARRQAINYVILHECYQRSVSFIFEYTWKSCLHKVDGRGVRGMVPFTSHETFEFCNYLFNYIGLMSEHLTRFLPMVAHAAPSTGSRAREVPGQRAADMPGRDDRRHSGGASVPCAEFQSPQDYRGLGPELAVAWGWCIAAGIAVLLIAQTPEGTAAKGRSLRMQCLVKIRGDGLLVDGHRPWITAATLDLQKGIRPLALNTFVLELFHEQLLGFYAKIDFTRIRERMAEIAAQCLGS